MVAAAEVHAIVAPSCPARAEPRVRHPPSSRRNRSPAMNTTSGSNRSATPAIRCANLAPIHVAQVHVADQQRPASAPASGRFSRVTVRSPQPDVPRVCPAINGSPRLPRHTATQAVASRAPAELALARLTAGHEPAQARRPEDEIQHAQPNGGELVNHLHQRWANRKPSIAATTKLMRAHSSIRAEPALYHRPRAPRN